MKLKNITLSNITYKIVDSSLRQQIAQQFSSLKSYSPNDFCIYDNKLYQCVNETSGEWSSENWEQKKIVDLQGETIYIVDKYVVDYDSERIIDKTIENCEDKDVDIVGNYVFRNCSSLTSVSFPNCTSIGNGAFRNCSSLTSVSFPNCTTIGSSAFAYCSSLTSVSFPNCTIIGSSAFIECRSLTSVYLLASSVCTLQSITAFYSTPMSKSTYTGSFGSIYVPSSLVSAYKSATNWVTYSNRIVTYE